MILSHAPRVRLRGTPRKDMPNAFTKHAAANAPVSASAAPPRGDIIFEVMDGALKPEKQGLIGKPFAHKTVKRRQCAYRDRTDQKD